jgi:hypothetical protein
MEARLIQGLTPRDLRKRGADGRPGPRVHVPYGGGIDKMANSTGATAMCLRIVQLAFSYSRCWKICDPT